MVAIKADLSETQDFVEEFLHEQYLKRSTQAPPENPIISFDEIKKKKGSDKFLQLIGNLHNKIVAEVQKISKDMTTPEAIWVMIMDLLCYLISETENDFYKYTSALSAEIPKIVERYVKTMSHIDNLEQQTNNEGDENDEKLTQEN